MFTYHLFLSLIYLDLFKANLKLKCEKKQQLYLVVFMEYDDKPARKVCKLHYSAKVKSIFTVAFSGEFWQIAAAEMSGCKYKFEEIFKKIKKCLNSSKLKTKWNGIDKRLCKSGVVFARVNYNITHF